jgi:biopolymer transport protein ExbD
VQVDGEPVADAKSLEAAVRGKILTAPLTSVQVRADRALTFGNVEPVLRACGQGGAKSVRLATERIP